MVVILWVYGCYLVDCELISACPFLRPTELVYMVISLAGDVLPGRGEEVVEEPEASVYRSVQSV